MRTVFHEQLDEIREDLAEICSLVEDQLRSATRSLLDGDAEVAERVIDGDAEVDRGRERVEEEALALLSLQAPVAGDLRLVVGALRIIADLERMGDLAVHIAKIARLRTPNQAVPEIARPTIARMAEVAETMVARTGEVIRDRSVADANDLTAMDEEMDRLRRDSFAVLLGAEWDAGVEPAVDLALLGRYYERIADHAVTVANRIIFTVTGAIPEE